MKHQFAILVIFQFKCVFCEKTCNKFKEAEMSKYQDYYGSDADVSASAQAESKFSICVAIILFTQT